MLISPNPIIAPFKAPPQTPGPIHGTMHSPIARLFAMGRSLHPLERSGAVAPTGLPNVPVCAIMGDPNAGDPPWNLEMPPVWNPALAFNFGSGVVGGHARGEGTI